MNGLTGTVTVASRGEAGPGEVEIRIRGGRERFIARSATPIPIGTPVLVIETHPHRTVTVVEWEGLPG